MNPPEIAIHLLPRVLLPLGHDRAVRLRARVPPRAARARKLARADGPGLDIGKLLRRTAVVQVARRADEGLHLHAARLGRAGAGDWVASGAGAQDGSGEDLADDGSHEGETCWKGRVSWGFDSKEWGGVETYQI